jgi:hypothetical protein
MCGNATRHSAHPRAGARGYNSAASRNLQTSRNLQISRSLLRQQVDGSVHSLHTHNPRAGARGHYPHLVLRHRHKSDIFNDLLSLLGQMQCHKAERMRPQLRIFIREHEEWPRNGVLPRRNGFLRGIDRVDAERLDTLEVHQRRGHTFATNLKGALQFCPATTRLAPGTTCGPLRC